jgi:hypothetical protein
VRIGEYESLMDKAFDAGLRLLVVGPPGCGKTQIPQDYCERKGYDCFALCMPLLDPPFLMGYPYRENGHAGHAPFGVLSKCLEAEKPTLLVLDEMGGATNTTLKAALRLLQFGEVCGKRLPGCVRIIALSNDVGHGADVMGILEPMKDRFISIIVVEPHVDDTIGYAMARQWPAWLMGFLRNDPGALLDCKPLKSMQRSGSTPRGWEYVAQLDAGGFLDLPQGPELIHGAVGRGRGTEALAFRALVNELPDIDGVIMDPENAPIPENPGARFLIASTLSLRMAIGNFGQITKYLKRLPPMFHAFSVRDAIRGEARRKAEGKLPDKFKGITASRDWTTWVNSAEGREIISAGGGES